LAFRHIRNIGENGRESPGLKPGSAPAGQADFLKIVIRGVKIDSVFLDQHGDPVAWHLARQQGENLNLVQGLLRAGGADRQS